MYPFGYGLSYTTFQYRDLVVSADQVPICGNLSISAVVENVGSRDGEEVRQFRCLSACKHWWGQRGWDKRDEMLLEMGENSKRSKGCEDGESS